MFSHQLKNCHFSPNISILTIHTYMYTFWANLSLFLERKPMSNMLFCIIFRDPSTTPSNSLCDPNPKSRGSRPHQPPKIDAYYLNFMIELDTSGKKGIAVHIYCIREQSHRSGVDKSTFEDSVLNRWQLVGRINCRSFVAACSNELLCNRPNDLHSHF